MAINRFQIFKSNSVVCGKEISLFKPSSPFLFSTLPETQLAGYSLARSLSRIFPSMCQSCRENLFITRSAIFTHFRPKPCAFVQAKSLSLSCRRITAEFVPQTACHAHMCKSGQVCQWQRHLGYKSILHSPFLSPSFIPPPFFACAAADGFFVLLCSRSRPY